MSSHGSLIVSGVPPRIRVPLPLLPDSRLPFIDTHDLDVQTVEVPLRIFQERSDQYQHRLPLLEVEYSPNLVGDSTAIREIRELIPVVAVSDVSVLVTGETGTGKELVARDIHAKSLRVDKPFIAVNCAAIPKETIESTLFGHEHGAFTDASKKRAGLFEAADGGTLFLDEVGELGPHLQAKLSRALEYGTFQRVGGTGELKVNVRGIFATNCNINEALRSGKIARGFFDQIAIIHIHIPPLRERKEDIPLLANHLLGRFISLSSDRSVYGITEEAIEKLQGYNWPGNVRELENVIKRALIVTGSGVIDKEDILITPLETSVKVLEHIDDLAQSDVPVLISGETGTGKERIAREIHLRSKHNGKPIVVVNCAALNPHLAESELFGHVRGAFTGAQCAHKGFFELANDSTLFLDQIDQLDYEIQTKLLRALQEGEITLVGTNEPKKVSVRILAATNIDLEKAVEDGKFREDLYHRLSVVPIHLPPLRERRQEIPELALRFLEELKGEKNITGISQAAMVKLEAHDWPGNVRELKTVIQRAIVLTPDGSPIDHGKVIINSNGVKTNGNGQLKEIKIPDATGRRHLVLDRYLEELDEYTASNGKKDEVRVKFLLYRAVIALMLLKSDGERLTEIEIAKRLGINRNTLRGLVIKSGYSSTKDLVSELRKELNKPV